MGAQLYQPPESQLPGQQPGDLAAEEQATSGTSHEISDNLASQACPCTAPLPARPWVLQILQLEAS